MASDESKPGARNSLAQSETCFEEAHETLKQVPDVPWVNLTATLLWRSGLIQIRGNCSDFEALYLKTARAAGLFPSLAIVCERCTFRRRY